MGVSAKQGQRTYSPDYIYGETSDLTDALRRVHVRCPCAGADRPAHDSLQRPDSPAGFLESWSRHVSLAKGAAAMPRHGHQIARSNLVRPEHGRRKSAKSAREADCAHMSLWIEGCGGPAQPSPTIGQCINGGLGWLEVECNLCKTRASLPLDAIRRPRARRRCGSWKSLKCRSCRKGRYAPPVQMVKLTETRSHRTSGSIRMRSRSRSPAHQTAGLPARSVKN
jgi:hypothetical protein